MSLSLLLVAACVLVLSPVPSHTIHPADTSNGTIQENFGAHCVPMPPSLQTICSPDLGWPTRMQLPNLLGHKSYEELNTEVASMAILQGENIGKVDCKSLDQLKLVLCATIAPPCFDVVLPPCRQACLRARTSCRQSLQRNAIEWPKILDCRRFPVASEICISRMLPLSFKNVDGVLAGMSAVTESSIVRKPKHRASASSKWRRKNKPSREQKFNATTTSAPSSPLTEITTNLGPLIITEKLPNDIANVHELTSRNTTSNDILTDDKSLTMPSPSSAPTMPMTETSTTTTTATTVTTTIQPTTANAASETTTLAMIEATTTAPPANSTSLPSKAPSLSSETQSESNVGPLEMRVEKATRVETSTTITRGLKSFLCASSPEWLIKTKLTDNQLMSATKKRKLRIRSYRQIFGTFANSSTSFIRSTNSTTLTRASRSKSVVSAGVYLSLSNTTSFIYPLGSSLHCQLMSNDSPQENQQADESGAASSSEKTPSKTYLIFGTTSDGIKTASFIVLWPGTKFSKDIDSQASADVVKTYRDFKLRQLAACQQGDRLTQRSRLPHHREDSGRIISRNRSHENTSITTTMANHETSTGDWARVQKRKRKEGQRRA